MGLRKKNLKKVLNAMKKIINDLINEYKEKNIDIVITYEDDNKIIINVISYFENKKYIEDLEILNSFTDKDIIKTKIEYLIKYSHNRYLRGE